MYTGCSLNTVFTCTKGNYSFSYLLLKKSNKLPACQFDTNVCLRYLTVNCPLKAGNDLVEEVEGLLFELGEQ